MLAVHRPDTDLFLRNKQDIVISIGRYIEIIVSSVRAFSGFYIVLLGIGNEFKILFLIKVCI